MTIRWLRILGAAIVAEIIPIVLLVALVAIFGPSDAGEAQEYASRLGSWVGPLGGALATFLLALWVARPLVDSHVLHGALLGFLVALLDAGLLIAGSTGFQWLFVISGVGRIVAGTLGGYLAHHRSITTHPEADQVDDS